MAANPHPQAPQQPQPYVIVAGNDLAIADIAEGGIIVQSLAWIGFNDAQRQLIITEAFGNFDDIRATDEDDVDAMVKDLTSRTAANGRIIVGIRRTKLLKGFTHWVEDFYRVSGTPDIVGLNTTTFRAALNVALKREEVRVNLRKQLKTAADAASPGPLESERKWKTWEEKFEN